MSETRPPLFSVVIPAWDAAMTVRSAVASVLRQSQDDLEVIVVDDGSTDDTAANVASIPDERVRLLMRPHGGRASARNAGIASARGRYVAFLDSDEMWLPRYLELAATTLETDPKPGLAYTDAYRFDPSAARISSETVMEHHGAPATFSDDPEEFMSALCSRNFVWAATALPSYVLAEVGGFDEALGHGEEWDLWLRILRRGYRAARIPGIQGVARNDKPSPLLLSRATRLARGARPGEGISPPTPPELAELLDDLGFADVHAAADATNRTRVPSRAQTWQSWRRDRARYPRDGWLTQRSLWAVATFRLGQAVRGCPMPIRVLLAPIHYMLTLLVRITTGIEIAGGAAIGPGLRIFHAGPIIINSRATVGSDCTVNVGVIIGNRDSAAAPVIGDRVTISAGSYVLGAVNVGDNAVVGAMSLVLADVPAGAIVAGVPARVIRTRPGLAG